MILQRFNISQNLAHSNSFEIKIIYLSDDNRRPTDSDQLPESVARTTITEIQFSDQNEGISFDGKKIAQIYIFLYFVI